MQRKGVTLLEVLIVVAILAILIGLTLAGIQRVRSAAIRTQSENNLRQIILATHQLADTRTDRVGGLTKTTLPIKPLYQESTIFWELIPYVHGNLVPPSDPTNQQQILDYVAPRIKVYLSPADPSLYNYPAATFEEDRLQISYSANMLTFDGAMSFPLGIPDGTSNTLAYSERYYWCAATQENFNYGHIFPIRPGVTYGGTRRATFADKGWKDVVPVKDAATGHTVASRRGVTFQHRPTVAEADSRMLQTPHPGGLPVAFFDGGVRTISPGVAEHVFWGLITPNGGEVVSLD